MPWFGLAVFIGSTALEATLPAINQHLPRDITATSAAITIPRDGGPCGVAANGVPQHNYDDCCNDLKGKTLTVTAVDGTSGKPRLNESEKRSEDLTRPQVSRSTACRITASRSPLFSRPTMLVAQFLLHVETRACSTPD
jgi:hypothetical protein